MSDLFTLMQTSPETLAATQHKALKEHAISVLTNITNYIRDERYDGIKSLLFDSPSGDDHGMDNTCINFSYMGRKDDVKDIGDILNLLWSLKNQSKQVKK